MSSPSAVDVAAERANVLGTGHGLAYQGLIGRSSARVLAGEMAWVDLETASLRFLDPSSSRHLREQRVGIIARIVHTEYAERKADKSLKRRKRYVEKGV